MPMAGSLWDTRALKAVVADGYGLPPHQMPMVVKTREEEIEDLVMQLVGVLGDGLGGEEVEQRGHKLRPRPGAQCDGSGVRRLVG